MLKIRLLLAKFLDDALHNEFGVVIHLEDQIIFPQGFSINRAEEKVKYAVLFLNQINEAFFHPLPAE